MLAVKFCLSFPTGTIRPQTAQPSHSQPSSPVSFATAAPTWRLRTASSAVGGAALNHRVACEAKARSKDATTPALLRRSGAIDPRWHRGSGTQRTNVCAELSIEPLHLFGHALRLREGRLRAGGVPSLPGIERAFNVQAYGAPLCSMERSSPTKLEVRSSASQIVCNCPIAVEMTWSRG
jgi:hypothetical protein